MSAIDELLPCPFCGGEAHTYKNNLWHVACERAHNGCVTMSAFITEAEAVEAWNTRSDYYGYEQAAIEAWENIKKWNTRSAGTCEWLLEHSGTLYDKWRCSKCGYLYVDSRTDGGATGLDPNYCPNCGRAVKR